MLVWYGLAALLLLIGVAIVLLRTSRRSPPISQPSSAQSTPVSTNRTTLEFASPALVDAHAALYKLAFDVARIDYRILGDHLRVLQSIEAALGNILGEAKYFPRKPALLPKLMRAINTLDTGRGEIVRLILQDAVLAGNVLKRANSAYYRQGQEVVESVDRAVMILGNEGLRAPVASAVMQPVFQLPSGFFERFAPITWEQARRAALAAEEFARAHNTADAFVAHLAGMLGSLGRIVLFRLTHDKYRQHGNLMPRAEVFARVMSDHGAHVTRAIAAAWEMSDAFLEALDAQAQATPPHRMTPLAATVYYGNVCGVLATLHHHALLAEDVAHSILKTQGLDAGTLPRLWRAALQAELA